jgi:dihydrofolate reductase
MARIFLFMMVSLDGYFEGKQHDISWHVVDKEFSDFALQQLEPVSTLLFGRRTYELMAGFWPTEQAKSDPETARLMNTKPKVVVSSSLTKADWAHTKIISSNVAAELKKLVSAQSGDIVVFGSSKLCVSLIAMGLLDELRLMINPVILGGGTPLFDGIPKALQVRLRDKRVFNSGNVLLTYGIGGS